MNSIRRYFPGFVAVGEEEQVYNFNGLKEFMKIPFISDLLNQNNELKVCKKCKTRHALAQEDCFVCKTDNFEYDIVKTTKKISIGKYDNGNKGYFIMAEYDNGNHFIIGWMKRKIKLPKFNSCGYVKG